MKETSKLYFKVISIVDLVIAIILSITVVGLIIAIPLFIAYSKFNKASVMTDEELIKNRSSLFGWGIFSAIVLSPSVIGLIAIILIAVLVNNYIKDLEDGNFEKANKSFGEAVKAETSNIVNNTKEAFGIKSGVDKEKAELEKLNKLKEEGLITEEEYALKRKKILNLD